MAYASGVGQPAASWRQSHRQFITTNNTAAIHGIGSPYSSAWASRTERNKELVRKQQHCRVTFHTSNPTQITIHARPVDPARRGRRPAALTPYRVDSRACLARRSVALVVVERPKARHKFRASPAGLNEVRPVDSPGGSYLGKHRRPQ